MSAEAYRGIIFLVTWFLVLEVVAALLLIMTQGPIDMLIAILMLAIITGALLVILVLKARKAVLEELGEL